MNKTVKNILLRIFLLLGTSAFIVLVVMAKMRRDDMPVRNIQVEIDDKDGNYLVTKEQVLALLQENFSVENRVLSGKELELIEKQMARIPQVKKANAFTDNQGNLSVKIVQRIPVLRVYTVHGTTYYVDETGVKFPTTDNFTARVPVLTGNISERADTLKKASSPGLVAVLNVVKKVNQNKVWKELIGQYNLNEKNEIELIPRIGRAYVYFGNDEHIERKLKQLDIFYFEVLQKVGWDYYKVINIMYKEQVVCLK